MRAGEKPARRWSRWSERIADLGEDVLAGLLGHGLRTVGLAAIFALGSAGLVASLGISQTAAQQVRERLTDAALDQVTAQPGRDGSTGEVTTLPEDAVTRIEQISDVLAAGRIWQVSKNRAQVSRTDDTTVDPGVDLSVVGVESSSLDVYAATTSPSGIVDLFDNEKITRTAILGKSAAKALGIEAPGPGRRIHVSHLTLEVIGIISDTGRAPGLDTAVLVPRSVAQALGSTDTDLRLMARTRPGRAYAVAQVLAATLRPANPQSVAVDSVVDLRTLRRGVSTDLDTSAAALAVLMLFLATVTTANVMTMSVNDRRPEIALRRAVGMSGRSVAVSFLLEGALIGILGGAAGSAVGVFATLASSAHQNWDAVLSPWLAPVGLLCGLGVGLLAATRAALRAGRIPPALAIRAG